MKKILDLARRELAAAYPGMGIVTEARAVIEKFLKNDPDYSIGPLSRARSRVGSYPAVRANHASLTGLSFLIRGPRRGRVQRLAPISTIYFL